MAVNDRTSGTTNRMGFYSVQQTANIYSVSLAKNLFSIGTTTGRVTIANTAYNYNGNTAVSAKCTIVGEGTTTTPTLDVQDSAGTSRFKVLDNGDATITGKLTVNNLVNLLAKAGTTTSGDIWHDSTQNAVQAYVNAIEQTLGGVIFTQTATRTIADTVTETSLLTTGVGTLTLPANFFVAGKTVRITILGNVADTGTPTVTLKLKHGAVTIINSGAITFTNLTGTEEFRCVCDITCRTAGAAGASTVAGSVWFTYDTTTGAGAMNGLDIPVTTVTTVDTTASGALDLTFQWGTASASNTISSLIATVEVLN